MPPIVRYSGSISSLFCYQDNDLLLLNKPAGLLSVSGRGSEKQHALSSIVQEAFPDALIVHRLDMATSGLMVFARGAENQKRLSIAFANREVKKGYMACVAGNMNQAQGKIELPLITDWPNRPKQKVCYQQGKPSLTYWQLIQQDELNQTTRLHLEPYTGRSHQLRVHLAAIGHPILGDALYASDEHYLPYPRLMLHAVELSFSHPRTGEALNFTLPPDF